MTVKISKTTLFLSTALAMLTGAGQAGAGESSIQMLGGGTNSSSISKVGNAGTNASIVKLGVYKSSASTKPGSVTALGKTSSAEKPAAIQKVSDKKSGASSIENTQNAKLEILAKEAEGWDLRPTL